MRRALEETARRRTKQLEYNRVHGITPRTVEKSTEEILKITSVADAIGTAEGDDVAGLLAAAEQEGGAEVLLRRLEAEMLQAARQLEFERAASLRDRLEEVQATLAAAAKIGIGTVAAIDALGRGPRTRHEPRRVKRRFGPDR
jgi:excinuclease ABC subunit B